SPYEELPQHITIDLGDTYEVDTLKYVPRKDGEQNGTITSYHIYVSDDGEHFDKVASGEWEVNNQMKITSFDPVEASYIRLEAVKGHEGFASASEILLEEHAVIEAGDQIPLDLQVKKQNGQLENIDNVDVIYSS